MADSKTDAPFVFEGSVKSTAASNVSAVPADEGTVIVQVDHVRQAPRALAGFAGKEITLRKAPNEKLAPGEQGIFFTQGLVFADHLAVQSLGHDPLVASETRAALSSAGPVVQKLRRRIDEADAVVSGQVTDVRPHADTPLTAARAAGSGAPPLPRISEHEAFWHDAVIEVSGVHKGEKKRKVVVRFPDSSDVRWRNAPKFKKGQKGTWLLHKGGPGAGAAPVLARAVAAPSAEVYTALDPNDFHSASDQAVVQALLPSTGAPAVRAKRAAPKKATTAKKSLSKTTAAKAPAKSRRKNR